MRLNGNLTVLGQLKQAKFEQLSADPGSPVTSQIWFNTTETALKYFDGSSIQTIAKGGNLTDYLKLDGTTPMTGALTLSSNDQSAGAATDAVSKGHVDSIASTKQDNLTGATTTVHNSDLTASMIVVSDASGKLSDTVSATAAEAEYLAGVTSSIQTQLNGKEATLGYTPVDKAGDTMTGNLVMSNQNITGLAPASGPTDPVRQAEFEAALAGLDFQPDVDGRQTDATLDVTGHIAGDRYIIGDAGALNASFGTITGVASGDIVESDGSIFEVVYDSSVQGEGAITWNRDSNTFNFWNGIVWADFGGLAGVTAGIGLAKNGNDIYVNLGAGIKETPTDEVGIDAHNSGGLITTLDGTTPSSNTAAQLAIRIDGSSMETSAAGLKLSANGVTAVELNASVVSDGLQGAAGTALSVKTPAQSGLTVDTTGVYVDDVEMRTRALYRDGSEAMTGALTLSSNDQSAELATAAISKGHLDAAITVLNTASDGISTRLENGYFVYDGTGAAAVSHTVTHSMGNKYVSVQVVDASDEVVLPESITYTDANSLTVTFTNAETCRVIVTGLKAAA